MEDIEVLTIMQKLMLLIMEISAPILGVSIIVGLIVSIFQTITQIQESTLTFVPKLIAAMITIIVLLPWFIDVFISSTNDLFQYIVLFSKP